LQRRSTWAAFVVQDITDMGICKLCEQEAVLLRQSHIVPDFMFENLYNDKHRLHMFSPAEALKGNDRAKKPPTAPYDGDILCQKCDNEILGGYEGYAAQVLFGKNVPVDIAAEVKNTVDPKTGMSEHHITGLDYVKFKTFFLSILWRAHISRQPFFDEVDLGPYEPEFRRSVRNGFIGGENDFPVYCLGWLRASFPKDLIVKPIRVKWRRRTTAYLLIFQGLMVWIFMTRKNVPDELERFKLRQDGTMRVFGLNDSAARHLLAKVFNVDPRVLAGMQYNT